MATKSNNARKYYYVESFEVAQIVSSLKSLIKRKYSKKKNSLNNKTLKFKCTEIETELIMFLEDILRKKNILQFITPDEVDARVHRCCKEF